MWLFSDRDAEIERLRGAARIADILASSAWARALLGGAIPGALPDRGVAGELGHDDDHVAHGAAWCGPRNWSTGPRPAAGSQRESRVRYFRVGAVGQRQGRRAAVPAPNTFSQEWANYIAARIKRAGDHTRGIAMETLWPGAGRAARQAESRVQGPRSNARWRRCAMNSCRTGSIRREARKSSRRCRARRSALIA